MEDILDIIKNDLPNENESDSGGSNSDSDKEQEEEKVNKNILNVLKQVRHIIENPITIKKYSHSQAPKLDKIIKKNDEFEVQAKSTLAKYFSRASTDNKNKFKFRAESVKRALEGEKRHRNLSKPREMISKFSYSRGLYALKPKAAHIMFEKSVLKNNKPNLRLEQRTGNRGNAGVFLDCLDEGYDSNSEEEHSRKELAISAIMRKNSKYHSSDKIN
jgi:hypothetical protein